MALHNDLGKRGERIAREYLQQKGYICIESNYRIGRYEIDLIMQQDDTLVLVEVKTRQHNALASPYEAISNQKIRHIVSAAHQYLLLTQKNNPVRFDVIGITCTHSQHAPLIEHLVDAFYPPLF